MSKHQLKVLPEFFEGLISGLKTFELRKNDRGYAVGDTLVLREWDAALRMFTGHDVVREVTYVLEGGQYGLDAGYVILGLVS